MNISKIAKMAGVSSATVSRFLNDGYVSEEKREKIKAVIEQTGYIPSIQAQMLRTKRTKLIGVILPKVSSESVSKVVDGMTEKLSDEGYHIILGNTDNSVEKELEYLNIFKSNQVDGVIFIATQLDGRHKRLLKEMAIPVVIVGQQVEECSCVYHDDRKAAYEATKRLQEKCENIAYIGVTVKDKAAGLRRKQGFLQAVGEKQKDLDKVCMLEGEFTIESGYTHMKQLLKEREDIDGVFCATDNIAVGAMEAIRKAGKSIPQDIAVAGIGDTNISRVVTPKLTTVKYYYQQSGIEAATMLLEILKSGHNYCKKLKLGYQVIVRDTTG